MIWDVVIGLEIHVQLTTKSKLFSGASTAFGADPNTQAGAIDCAIPGTLPVVNKQAIHDAVLFGLAIDADINRHSVFERKNYFYPDLPKGYQTTQLHHPIVGRGHIGITLADGQHKRVRIHHAHLEEDAGKSLHGTLPGQSGIDLNRAGTPLIEIVTEPDMHSAEEAVAVAKKIHSIVTSIGICDGKMSQGSLRFDVNLSIKPQGETQLGTRTETKNLNSFRFMEKAIELETSRQIDRLESGKKVEQETRLYDADTHRARAMRSKEEANDYRYFPCPDLLPVVINGDTIDQLRAMLPELPDARYTRFKTQYKLSDHDAKLLSAHRPMADYFETTSNACNDSTLAANWITGELSAYLNQAQQSIETSPIDASQLGQLLLRIKDRTISGKMAKKVFAAMWQGEGDADTIIANKNLKQVSDTRALEQLVDDILAQCSEQVAQYHAADDKKRKKLLGGLMGPIMKASKGQANPALVNQILLNILNKSNPFDKPDEKR